MGTTNSNAIQSAISSVAGNLAADDPLRLRIRDAAAAVRDTTPLAQSFTNFVTINFVANAQLAAGGTAAMSFLASDIVDIAAICGATYVNVGTLLPFYRHALREITAAFAETGHRWVLDPVAAGLGADRTAILTDMRATPPTIVRGNASEIITLAAMWELPVDDDNDLDDSRDSRPNGVESADDVESALGAAKALARFLASKTPDGEAAVAVSGAVDLVTDGETVYRLPGGSAMMTKITGAGCSLGGVTATYLCVADPLAAALGASLLYNRASERAAATSDGPGTFQQHFLDELWKVSPAAIASGDIVAE
ncbi:hydroxyethylthiazole kinase [Bifidobacterium choloepi]|uniref:Hydroxyethylthiazole kinase n=1 Tax=Bifidobacterium choloepi TaxID=2614131 RepID=A0A6I5N1J2_9BIFI|nr:hydroxyethylthiazole kinase [Bifidobacterium choloepi]NEG70015.1 hydroxyethylthiazole kinase [Bifidobacterium choloepi]